MSKGSSGISQICETIQQACAHPGHPAPAVHPGKRSITPHLGFSLLELSIALVLMVIAFSSLAGFIVVAEHSDQCVVAKNAVVDRMRTLMEEIRSAGPEFLINAYQGATYAVEDVAGTVSGGDALSVVVDDTDPELLVVTINAQWYTGGRDETFVLATKIYNPNN